MKKFTTKRLKQKAFDVWLLYSLIFELHYRPRDVFDMEDWELGMLWAFIERHGEEYERMKRKSKM